MAMTCKSNGRKMKERKKKVSRRHTTKLDDISLGPNTDEIASYTTESKAVHGHIADAGGGETKGRQCIAAIRNYQCDVRSLYKNVPIRKGLKGLEPCVRFELFPNMRALQIGIRDCLQGDPRSPGIRNEGQIALKEEESRSNQTAYCYDSSQHQRRKVTVSCLDRVIYYPGIS
ncbi:hypothetical protein C0J52_10968 [Blattella germanica]|nr:hypothetical protein C0J52_10968 [Blattella germanica]